MQTTGAHDNQAKIMVVDDELHVLDSIGRVLDGEPYELLTAASGEEALSLLERVPVEIVVADYRMPGMTGVQLLKEVLKRWPDTVRIILSGYADMQSVIEAVNEGEIYRFITKPWDNSELKVVLAHAVERYEMAMKNRQLTEELKGLLDKNRYTELLYKSLTEKSFAGIYVVQGGVFKFVNESGAAITGYTVAELLESRSMDIVVEDDRESYRNYVRDVIKGRTREPHEYRIRTKDGRILVIMESLVPITYEGQTAMLGNAVDVTKQREAEARLREKEEQYRLLIEKALAGIYVIQDGLLCFVNDRAASYTEYTVEELIGTESKLLVHPEDWERLTGQTREMLAGKRTEPYEFRLVTKNGRVRWLMESSIPVMFQGRRAVLANCMDITMQKETENKLKDNEQVLHSIIQGTPIPAFVIGRDHRVIYWNRSLERLSGIRAEDVVGTNGHWQAFYREPRPCMADLIINEDMGSFAENDVDYVVRSPLIEGAYEAVQFFPQLGDDGRWLHYTAAPIRNAAGDMIGAIETLEDMTELKKFEAQLSQQLRFEQTLLDTIPQPVFYKDKNGIYLGCNKAYEEFMNLPRSRFVGKSVFEIAPRKLAEVYHEKDVELFGNPGTQIYEARVLDSNRRIHDVIFHKATFNDSQGGVAGLIGTIFDVTDLRILERKLRESEELYRTISEKSFAGIYIVQDGKFRFANSMAVSYTGYKAEEMLGKPYNEIVYSEDQEFQRRCSIEMIKGMRAEPYEYRIVARDGQLRWIIETVSVINFEGARAVLGNCMDITQQKLAEMKMKESERLYRLLTERSFAGVYVVQDKIFKFINSTAAAYAGFTSGELEGRPSQTMLVHPEDREAHSRQAREMIKGMRKEPLEFRIMTKDGQVRWIMETLAPIVFEGRPAVLGNSMEITAQKRAEKELVSTMKRLETAYEDLASIQEKVIQQQKMASIGQLSAGIAHEINNPMGFIAGNLGVLETYAKNLESIIKAQKDALAQSVPAEGMKAVDDEWKRLKIDRILDDIHKLIQESVAGADRIKRIVLDLMRFSVSDESEHKPGDINAALSRVISVLMNDIEKKAALREDLEQLPQTRCNIGTLSQAFMNIITNALQAIDGRGEITVRTRVEGDSITVSFTDTGHGIPADIQARIFEPFFTTRDVGKGMGLGLSAAYETVKKHRGEISVESGVGRGTTITVRIPIVK